MSQRTRKALSAHVGAIREIPDLVVRPTRKAMVAQRVIAAREDPGLRDHSAQSEPKPHHRWGLLLREPSFDSRSMSYPIADVLGRVERRRRFSVEQKVAVLAEATAPGA